jgi:alkanesulfonate monooxygenase SsuD/methylene tetrahydromethanopterin reductase-like flavin-dependent oxidoreductase (luciferase family)
LELAPAVETFGYTRYWLSEHQPQPSPSNLAVAVAGLTEHIRVGTAGILLNFCAPLKAAADFQLLEALYPGHIDAGFCPGGAAPELLTELMDGRPPWTREDFAAALVKHLRNTPATPTGQSLWRAAHYQPPEIWLHGNSTFLAGLAAQHGLALGVSLCHRPATDLRLLQQYRHEFQSAGALQRPRVALLVAGICAATTERAQELLADRMLTGVHANIIGTPAYWRAELERLQTAHQPDDIIVLDLCRLYENRLTSYRLLAEAVGSHANAASRQAAA